MEHRLAVFDVDGTLVHGQSQRFLLGFLLERKYISFFRFIWIYAWFAFYSMGMVSNPEKILNFALATFLGETEDTFDAVIDEFVRTQVALHIFPKAYSLVAEYRDKGYEVVFLSAAIEPIVSGIAHLFGVSETAATECIFENGRFTGRIKWMYSAYKTDWLTKFCGEHSYSLDNVAVFTDHDSDTALLAMVGEPYVVNPTARLRTIAVKNHWPIISLA